MHGTCHGMASANDQKPADTSHFWQFRAPGPDPLLPLTTQQFNRAVHAAADRAAIKKRVTPHIACGGIFVLSFVAFGAFWFAERLRGEGAPHF